MRSHRRHRDRCQSCLQKPCMSNLENASFQRRVAATCRASDLGLHRRRRASRPDGGLRSVFVAANPGPAVRQRYCHVRCIEHQSAEKHQAYGAGCIVARPLTIAVVWFAGRTAHRDGRPISSEERPSASANFMRASGDSGDHGSSTLSPSLIAQARRMSAGSLRTQRSRRWI